MQPKYMVGKNALLIWDSVSDPFGVKKGPRTQDRRQIRLKLCTDIQWSEKAPLEQP